MGYIKRRENSLRVMFTPDYCMAKKSLPILYIVIYYINWTKTSWTYSISMVG